jgi:2-methylcitrate dehydratase PrpD
MRLDVAQVRHALGLAATQAAGLKAMFGSMAKPLHAGKAAMNGLMAAQLAQAGFTANDDAIEGAQGFVRTQCPGEPEAPVQTRRWAIQDTLYKFHAACYLTHASIEALKAVRRDAGLAGEAVEQVELCVAPGHDSVCNIATPQTGLEVKFSLRHLAAMVLAGRDTADMAAYTDACAEDAALQAMRDKVHVRFEQLDSQKGSRVVVTGQDGCRHAHYVDVGVPSDDLPGQWQRLLDKGRAITQALLTGSEYQALSSFIETMDERTSLKPLFEAITA